MAETLRIRLTVNAGIAEMMADSPYYAARRGDLQEFAAAMREAEAALEQYTGSSRTEEVCPDCNYSRWQGEICTKCGHAATPEQLEQYKQFVGVSPATPEQEMQSDG